MIHVVLPFGASAAQTAASALGTIGWFLLGTMLCAAAAVVVLRTKTKPDSSGHRPKVPPARAVWALALFATGFLVIVLAAVAAD